MQLLLSFLWLVLVVGASRNAKFAGESADTDLVSDPDLSDSRVPEVQCISSFYHEDAKQNMCGKSTFANDLNNHCSQGIASLVDDCNALIMDLLGQNGGGFWGYTNESAPVVIASHDSCTFSITVKDDKDLFNIGIWDVIDLITLALSQQGNCGDELMVGVNGDMWCKYRGKPIDTRWVVGGPRQMCGGGGTTT